MIATDTDLAQRLRAAVTRLNRRLRSGSLGGISPAQASALAMIERLGDPAIGDLAAAEQVRPPSMTRIVDALEATGLVARAADPTDRRSMRVTLTAEGRRALGSIRRRKAAFLESRLADLDAPSRRALAEALPLLERLAED